MSKLKDHPGNFVTVPRAAGAWLTLRDCADQLKCSVESVRTLCRSGQLPYANVGAGERQRYRVHVEDFRRFLRQRHHGDRTQMKPMVSAIPTVPNLCGM